LRKPGDVLLILFKAFDPDIENILITELLGQILAVHLKKDGNVLSDRSRETLMRTLKNL
jgi:hypothetical protein